MKQSILKNKNNQYFKYDGKIEFVTDLKDAHKFPSIISADRFKNKYNLNECTSLPVKKIKADNLEISETEKKTAIIYYSKQLNCEITPCIIDGDRIEFYYNGEHYEEYINEDIIEASNILNEFLKVVKQGDTINYTLHKYERVMAYVYVVKEITSEVIKCTSLDLMPIIINIGRLRARMRINEITNLKIVNNNSISDNAVKSVKVTKIK